MNTKYIKYIDYIVSDIEAPYFKNIRDYYGLPPNEYEMVLSKIYNQPVTTKNNSVHDTNSVYDGQGNEIYYETSNGYWWKRKYDANGNNIYYEDSTGFWVKSEYDTNGNNIYGENSSGDWYKYEYDNQGNRIYWEDSDGYIKDNR